MPDTNPIARQPLLANNRPGPAATIASTGTAVPPNLLTREIVKEYFGKAFSISGRRLNAILEVVDNARIEQRHTIFPVDQLIAPRSLTETSIEYRKHAIALGRAAVQQALDRAHMSPRDIDLFITTSCTGVMIPSLDAYLAQEMGFRSDVRRLPITELGCAAGAAGLTRAWEYLLAYPHATVLLASVELATLTFQRGDLSQANLISSVLFGDGAAAAVITGRPAPGPRILAGQSHLFPDSLAAMGFELRDCGFHIVLSKDVPEMIRVKIGGLVDDFLSSHGLARKDIHAYVLHPGGQKLLGNMEQELGLCPCQVAPSWNVLRDYGNLSSASVLFVLNEWLTSNKVESGDRGLLAAFGPGFSAEMLLLQWN